MRSRCTRLSCEDHPQPCLASEARGKEGIVGYLTQQARKYPAAFLSLIGRVLPLQVQGRGTSEQIVVEIVYRRYPDRDEPKLVEHVTGPFDNLGTSLGTSRRR